MAIDQNNPEAKKNLKNWFMVDKHSEAGLKNEFSNFREGQF